MHLAGQASRYGTIEDTMTASAASPSSASLDPSSQPLSSEELSKMHAYWRAGNYVSAGQIYLCANPLLREPLTLEHIKQRLLGHWGTTPGRNSEPRRAGNAWVHPRGRGTRLFDCACLWRGLRQPRVACLLHSRRR